MNLKRLEEKTPYAGGAVTDPLVELVERIKDERERLEKEARELTKERNKVAASLLLSTSLNKELKERVEKMEAEKERDDVEKAEIKRKLTKEIAKKMEGKMAEAKANLEKKYEERLTSEREKLKAEMKKILEQLESAQQENAFLRAKLNRLMSSTLQSVIINFHNRRLFLLDTCLCNRIRMKKDSNQ